MGRKTDFSNCYIYHIIKMEVVHYVGSTSNMNSRKSSHKYKCGTEHNKNYNLDIYKYIRDHGGFDNFQMIPIRKLENVKNKTDLLIAERLEMENFTGLKNMRDSYTTKEESLEKNREWQKTIPEKHLAKIRQWRQNNPEKFVKILKNGEKQIKKKL
jgi:hypothetical protein